MSGDLIRDWWICRFRAAERELARSRAATVHALRDLIRVRTELIYLRRENARLRARLGQETPHD